MDNQITVIYGADSGKITTELLEAENLASRIPKNALIGIKPNLVVARPADSGATTHTEMVEALIIYLQKYGHTNIIILEGSWVGDNTKRAFRICGYETLSKKYNVPLIDTKDDDCETKCYDGISMEICKKALEVDYLINMPVLKGHCQTAVTGALKNMKGIISDNEKRHFHKLGLHKPIAYLNKLIQPQFILVDGICGDLDFEEGGNPVQMNRIFSGTDPVLIDSYIASCMGYKPEEIEYIRIAAKIGVGSMDLDNANIKELNQDHSTAIPGSTHKVKHLASYTIPKDACSACYANLIQALARLDDDGKLNAFAKNKICIGQGYKDLTGKYGIGNCTQNCEAFVNGCPPTTPAILAFLRKSVEI